MRDMPAHGYWIYAGFWIRVWASIIDSALLLLIVFPLLSLIVPGLSGPNTTGGRLITPDGRIDYGALSLMPALPGPLHILIYWVLPAAVVVLFWLAREATPGKMAIGARIVDARLGTRPSARQYIGRYLGYYVSTIPLGLGLIWVGIDPRKQGWHDKLARTVVVRRPRTVETVRFEGSAEQTGHDKGWQHE